MADLIFDPVLLPAGLRTRAAETLTKAFLPEAGFIYALPDERDRAAHLRRFFGALVAYCGHYGEVYTTSAVTGVACWLPPRGAEGSLWRMLRTGFALPRAILALKGESRRRMAAFMDYNDRIHKQVISRPHWYLGALGVEPAYQRRGIGCRLLAPVLAKADASGTPCYLETQSEDNVRFYTRHGFVAVHQGEVPGHGWPMWAMIREPNA